MTDVGPSDRLRVKCERINISSSHNNDGGWHQWLINMAAVSSADAYNHLLITYFAADGNELSTIEYMDSFITRYIFPVMDKSQPGLRYARRFCCATWFFE